jgi:hypothetical protein
VLSLYSPSTVGYTEGSSGVTSVNAASAQDGGQFSSHQWSHLEDTMDIGDNSNTYPGYASSQERSNQPRDGLAFANEPVDQTSDASQHQRIAHSFASANMQQPAMSETFPSQYSSMIASPFSSGHGLHGHGSALSETTSMSSMVGINSSNGGGPMFAVRYRNSLGVQTVPENLYQNDRTVEGNQSQPLTPPDSRPSGHFADTTEIVPIGVPSPQNNRTHGSRHEGSSRLREISLAPFAHEDDIMFDTTSAPGYMANTEGGYAIPSSSRIGTEFRSVPGFPSSNQVANNPNNLTVHWYNTQGKPGNPSSRYVGPHNKISQVDLPCSTHHHPTSVCQAVT